MAMGSTLITRAPCSAIIIEASDAVIMVENSRIVIDSSGFISTPSLLIRVPYDTLVADRPTIK